jgi:hypothetical protein
MQHLDKQNIFISSLSIWLLLYINIIVGSSKRNDELQSSQVAEIQSMIVSNEIEKKQTKLVLCNNDLEILDDLFIFILFVA